MARRAVDVIASGMMVIRKRVHKDLGGGKLGLRQVRRMKNIVTSPKLLAFQGCMAGNLAGKTYPNLKAVQDAFLRAKDQCKGKG